MSKGLDDLFDKLNEDLTSDLLEEGAKMAERIMMIKNEYSISLLARKFALFLVFLDIKSQNNEKFSFASYTDYVSKDDECIKYQEVINKCKEITNRLEAISVNIQNTINIDELDKLEDEYTTLAEDFNKFLLTL